VLRDEVRRAILYEYLRAKGETPRDMSPSNLADRLAGAVIGILEAEMEAEDLRCCADHERWAAEDVT
jgi:hypothetical protein